MAAVAIVGAARTPMGAFMGELSGVAAPQLGGVAIAAALSRAGIATDGVDAVLMGNVLPAGLGQAPARQAALAAGLALSTPCTGISKVCGSGMEAVILSAARIATGADIVVAGGMESMSNAPHLIAASRRGQRLGHGRMIDHMFHDGLEDAYQTGALMGTFAEACATNYGFTRSQQDVFAVQSLDLALAAAARGDFAAEIAPVTVTDRRGDTVIASDEQPRIAQPAKIPHLKPAFAKDGTVTAASSSSISDGAAALVLASDDAVRVQGLVSRARIMGSASHAQEPGLFTTAPVFAARKLLSRLGWAIGDVDLWEVNEAFAVVALAFLHDMGVPRDRLNVNGGACALGHPIGASGARIIVTLLHAMEARDARWGIAAICIGGGEALAVALER